MADAAAALQPADHPSQLHGSGEKKAWAEDLMQKNRDRRAGPGEQGMEGRSRGMRAEKEEKGKKK